ncbi:MAG: hypothetical protein QXK65_00610 [Candidatus Micrarchaeaceae archaeon]
MKGYNYALLAVASLIILDLSINVPAAQYWFQSGVRSSNSAAFNTGALANIQTIYQNVSGGSFGFWIGEDLSNGAFVQVGYEISNSSGYFPRTCSPSGCSNYTFISAGVPTWFWEYFPSGYSGSNFYGGIGVNASAGSNGTFNTYSFSSSGNTWNFYFNGNLMGSVDLGTGSSGPNPPTAFAEYANSNTNNMHMQPVKFRNLEFMQGGVYKLVPKGYSYIGYGKGSESALPNPYGVSEINNYVDYFEVGSGIPYVPNNTLLWTLGYSLDIRSEYANLSSIENYSAYSMADISAPRVIYLSKTERVVFEGWQGAGPGSYSGNNPNATVQMNGNITETALWQKQYYLNVTTKYGSVVGGGWYNADTVAQIGVSQEIVPVSNGVRAVFKGWSTGISSNSIKLVVNSSLNISAVWQLQYLVNASSPYGKVSGVGWYNADSPAQIKINITNVTTGPDSRMSFEKWTNGYENASISVEVTTPLFISAVFVPQYLINFVMENAYGNPISVQYLNVAGSNITSQTFLTENKTYSVSYAEYKGVLLLSNQRFSVSSPQSVYVKLPVYNVAIHTSSIFGTPVNASLLIKFKNGTTSTLYTGKNGTAILYNVPYGYVDAQLQYFGISQTAFAENGNAINVTMITPSLIIIIILGALIIIVVGKAAAIINSKTENKGLQTPKSKL